jgi:hypothetical protein
VAVADLELLRLARTDLDEIQAESPASIADRLRGLASFLPNRSEPEGPVRIGDAGR